MANKILADSLKKSINTLLDNATKKKQALTDRHNKKPHFIPVRYRVLGGILQSMNIQFGNFLEQVIRNIVAIDERY